MYIKLYQLKILKSFYLINLKELDINRFKFKW